MTPPRASASGPTAVTAPDRVENPWLRLLGGFALQDAQARDQPLPYEKVNLLLALLVLHSGAWERESLATLLWPDTDLAQARANLRRALFDLRKVLAHLAPDAMLQADKRKIGLHGCGSLCIDTREFALAQLDAASGAPDSRIAALRRACALYGGPLLAGMRLDTSPAIAAWLQPRRDALHRQHWRCLAQLADLLEQQGQHDAARDLAFEMLALDGSDEAALRRCMRLLGPARREEALRLYQDFCTRLAEELHLQPQPETQALAARLREAPAPVAPAPATLQRRRVVALVAEWRAATAAADDPEALEEALRRVLELAAQRLGAAAGWVQRAEGGELLAYFGHPEAQEHAARHALDAALDLIARCAPAGLALHIGLHTGWVHARPQPGSPDSLGELSREARRLAWQAGAGTACASGPLRALGQRHHRFAADSGQLLGALPPQQQAARLAQRPMVGRAAELELLCKAWADAQAGHVAVWICAEPGMGKTRLMQALRNVLRELDSPPPLTLLHCLPEFSHSPLHPVLAGLQQSLPGPDSPAPDEALAWLAQRTGLAARTLAPLKALLWPERCDADVEPLQQRELQQLLVQLFDAWAGGRPQLLMIEDLHWCDPSTVELLGSYLQRPAAAPALLVLSSREPPPPLLAPHVRRLQLQPLPDELLIQVIEQPPSEARQRAELLVRAQGVPLFAQELAHSMRQQPAERVPATLWDLLAARLDRLPPAARHLAQCAAVLGSDWDLDLLRATLPEAPDLRLDLELDRLRAAALLEARPDGRWHFRHALQREAAYESLGPSERRRLHRRAADARLGPLSVRIADDPARLAHHLSQCGDPVAAHYWLQAGRRAATQSAHQEACHALREGLAALELKTAAPDLVQRLRQPLLLQLGFSLLALEGYGSRSAHRLFEQARDAAGSQDGGAHFQALWGLWLGTRSEAGEPPALQLAEALLDFAQRSDDQAAIVQARYAVGNNLVFAGRLKEAVQALELAAEAGERLPGTPLALRFGEHGGIAAQAMSCWPLAWLGEREAAQQALQMALRQARSLGHAHTLCYVLCMGAVLQRHLRQPQAVLPLGQELAQLGERHGMALWQAVAAMVLGWAQAWQGDPAGVPPIQMAVAASAVAMPSTEATFLSFLCEALLRLERADEALPLLDRALRLASERQECYLLPELWRMRAMALHALGHDAASADAALSQARERARAMDAALWLARCEANAEPA